MYEAVDRGTERTLTLGAVFEQAVIYCVIHREVRAAQSSVNFAGDRDICENWYAHN